ncbi:MAG: universal stress protein [Nitrososphaeraceae archaeon]
MGIKISNVLVAIDGSENSIRAANYAIELSTKFKAELAVLTILDVSLKHFTSTFLTAPTYGKDVDKEKIRANKHHETIKLIGKESGISVRSEIISSSISPVGTIIDYIENNNIDLVIVGSRGLGGFKKLVLGSVASGLMSYSKCPVLVVK